MLVRAISLMRAVRSVGVLPGASRCFIFAFSDRFFECVDIRG